MADLTFRGTKKGYFDREFTMNIGQVTYPGYWWDEEDMGAWTAEKKIRIELNADPASRPKVKRRIPTVVIIVTVSDPCAHRTIVLTISANGSNATCDSGT